MVNRGVQMLELRRCPFCGGARMDSADDRESVKPIIRRGRNENDKEEHIARTYKDYA